MNDEYLKKLLEKYKSNKLDIDDIISELKKLPFEDINFAKIDHHRAIRTGHPEVILCEGKTESQIINIYNQLAKKNDNILLTRADKNIFESLYKTDSRLRYNELGRVILLESSDAIKTGKVLIISAGTADIPVAEEAAESAFIAGANVERIYDVGVAGIHRLLAYYDNIQAANCIVVVAGMEGALPSVVGGLAPCSVIAVPTSVGYGAQFEGLSALLTMLNSCSSNITVVNINNGFGAGFNAALINNK